MNDGSTSVVVRSSLAAAGPLERVDHAFVLVRRGGLELAGRALLAGAVPALALLAYYYAERVEGIGALRLPAAALLVASFIVRSWALAAVARAHVRALSEHAPIAAGAGGLVSVGRTAVVVGLGLWLWSWGLVLSAGGGAIGIALFVPWLAFRGLFAPSWLARAACAPESGWRAFRSALSDTTHQRMESFLVESFLLTALFGIAANLYGIFAFLVLVGRSFLGLEMALVDEFLSFRNTFVLLAVSLFAAVVLEPLRAALSAQVYVDARVRAEGLDLRSALDDAIARTSRRGKSSTEATEAASRAAVVLVAIGLGLGTLVLVGASASAQDSFSQPADGQHTESQSASEASPAATPQVSPEETASLPVAATPVDAAHDEAAREAAREILARDIFHDVDTRRSEGLSELIERLLAWLLEQEAPDAGAGDGIEAPSIPLPGPTFFIVVGVAFAIAVAVFLVLTRRRDEQLATRSVARTAEAVPDPRDRPPEEWLAEAGSLAAQGRYGEALRALYLATLVALDRRAWIRFESSLTNWQYLRQMPAGEAREDFRVLTRTFDVKVYGGEAASADDYARGRTLAERILRFSRPSLPPPPASSDGEAAP